MKNAKRYHSLSILFNLWGLAKTSFFMVIYLFIIRFGSESAFTTYGRIAFYLFGGISFVSIILKWVTHKYKIEDQSFHLYKGRFIKTKIIIPFSKIQNVNRRTSLFHRIFKKTSIRFETSMAGSDDAVIFNVISLKEADRLEELVGNSTAKDEVASSISDVMIITETSDIDSKDELTSTRTIHFNPTKKDIYKASFTSFSFLLLIPVVGSIYSETNQIFNIGERTEGIISTMMSSWWIVTLIIVVLVLVSITFGIVRTYLKYGKYEISSDDERIYIRKGVIDETRFSIAKEKVQAIEITQSPMKRILGLAAVKLTSAGNLNTDDEQLEINSLYPFLPVKKAYELISEMLPSYEVTEKMSRLPKKSLAIRMLKPSWLWIILTMILYYFQPSVFNLEQAWWILSGCFLLFICLLRVLDFLNTRYILNDHFIQLKNGSLSTNLFVSKRRKIVEVTVTRTFTQKILGLSSIGTINRAQPVHHASIDDIPAELAGRFYSWYVERRNEIKLK
ncbi:PH domain-containing protein [Salipaludibacillus sp. HK11]|uniref:PH domain-containing protein n=1 Tax=Salipaludibacillus sp. HK11 TaxID=3394320 RepID=UPI0039FD142A